MGLPGPAGPSGSPGEDGDKVNGCNWSQCICEKFCQYSSLAVTFLTINMATKRLFTLPPTDSLQKKIKVPFYNQMSEGQMPRGIGICVQELVH